MARPPDTERLSIPSGSKSQKSWWGKLPDKLKLAAAIIGGIGAVYLAVTESPFWDVIEAQIVQLGERAQTVVTEPTGFKNSRWQEVDGEFDAITASGAFCVGYSPPIAESSGGNDTAYIMMGLFRREVVITGNGEIVLTGVAKWGVTTPLPALPLTTDLESLAQRVRGPLGRAKSCGPSIAAWLSKEPARYRDSGRLPTDGQAVELTRVDISGYTKDDSVTGVYSSSWRTEMRRGYKYKVKLELMDSGSKLRISVLESDYKHKRLRDGWFNRVD